MSKLLERLERIERAMYSTLLNNLSVYTPEWSEDKHWLCTQLREQLAVNQRLMRLHKATQFLKDSAVHEMLCPTVYSQLVEDCICNWKEVREALADLEKIEGGA